MSEDSKKIKFDSVGWIFWLVVTVVLFVPAFFFSRSISYDDQKYGMLPWILGFILSSATSGVLTTVLNTILQNRVERIREAERKSNKKKKKKNG
jgi:Na+/proline symporter